MHFSIEFILLFAVASIVAILARRVRIPYTVALVFTGLVLGAAGAFEVPHLTQDLMYAVFLPGLLFEAAYHLELKDYFANKIAIHALAIPGLLLAILLTAVVLGAAAEGFGLITGFLLIHGLVLGAMVTETDPIAVVGLFKNLGAPKRLTVLVEGESLFNDGTAVVVFTVLVASVMGGDVTFGSAVLDFFRIVGLGLVIGLVVGFATAQFIRQVDDPTVEITLTVITAYGSFVLAESLHGSGVIATVVAGMMSGNYAARTGMRPSTRIAVQSFWDYFVFALNSIVFLLIGFEVKLDSLWETWPLILVAYAAVTLVRFLVVFTVSGILRTTRERLPWSWSGVLWWAGLRGGLSMVLALGLPADFPHREVLINMTFGVVLISILVQGLTMSPLLRWLGVVEETPGRRPYEVERGRFLAATAALRELDALEKEHAIHLDILAGLENRYHERLNAAEKRIGELHESREDFRDEEARAAARHLLVVEKDTVVQALRVGRIGEEAFAALSQEIDGRLVALEQQDEDGSGPDEPVA